MNALSGSDNETVAQVAFSTIVAKIENSDSRKYWNYVLKNLILLDRSIEASLFVKDISESYAERFTSDNI